MQRTNKKTQNSSARCEWYVCARVSASENRSEWTKKQPHTRATAAATAHNQIRNRRPIEIHAMKWTMCCLEFYSWRKFFSYIYAYVLVCMQIVRRRRLSLARAQTAIKHKIREEDSKWSKAKKHLNPHNGYCVHIQLWMTFTRFVQYIESIRRSCLLVGWLFSQFLFSSSISLYLSISLVPVWLFLIYACILCCFFLQYTAVYFNSILCVSGAVFCCSPFLFPLHSRFSTRLDEQWVDDDNDDNDVHKSSCIQTHRYCLHVSVVRPGLAWTGLCWNDDIWVWNHPIQMPLSLWRRSSHIHRYTHLLMCLYACVSM